jgi:outer membrane lipoprotein SlyB
MTMADTLSAEKVREAVGVFDGAETLEAAIDELQSSGFDRALLSLLAGERAIEAALGHRYTRVEELEDDPKAPRAAYVSTEAVGDAKGALLGGLFFVGAVTMAGAVVASGGTMAGAVVAGAMSGGAGALIGSALANLVEQHHADYLKRQLDKGGLLLWVRTVDAAHEARACEILGRHSAHDVHVHELPARPWREPT